MSHRLTVRYGGVESIETVRHIACLSWPVAYKKILSSGQLNYMLSQIYNSEILHTNLTKENHKNLIISDNARDVGFADISPHSHHSVPGKSSWKLHKLYVLPPVQGNGIGKRLLETSIDSVRENGGDYLLLNVNRENPAYHFYLKEGFEVLETGDFDIGKGFFMNDYVMGKTV